MKRAIFGLSGLAVQRLVKLVGFSLAGCIAVPAGAQRSVPCREVTPSPGPPYVTIASGQPASCFFCGNIRKFDALGAARTWEPVIEGPSATCLNATNARLVDRYAVEMAEVRGWIVKPLYVSEADEISFDLLVDLGWTTQAPVSYSLNALDNLVRYMTPVNVPYFGYQRGSTPPPPLPPFTPNSMLNGDRATWGGAYSPVIHVEIDGWGSARGDCACLDIEGDCFLQCTPTWWSENEPLGWTMNVDPRPPHLPLNGVWPFSTDGFNIGDYVRLVGTLWKDGAHAPGSGYAATCWDQQSTANVGWQEMHPVDFMERLDYVPPRIGTLSNVANPHVVAGYSLCSTDSGHNLLWDSFSIGPKPFPAAQPVLNGQSFGPVINWGTLDGSPNVFITGPGSGTNYGVSVIVGATTSTSARGLFNSFYEAYWSCTPTCANRCVDDGCGGSCPPTCPPPSVCLPGGGACCVPSCTGRCGGSDGCGGTCPTAPCPSGYECQPDGSCTPRECRPHCPRPSCQGGEPDGCGGTCDPDCSLCPRGECE